MLRTPVAHCFKKLFSFLKNKKNENAYVRSIFRDSHLEVGVAKTKVCRDTVGEHNAGFGTFVDVESNEVEFNI